MGTIASDGASISRSYSLAVIVTKRHANRSSQMDAFFTAASGFRPPAATETYQATALTEQITDARLRKVGLEWHYRVRTEEQDAKVRQQILDHIAATATTVFGTTFTGADLASEAGGFQFLEAPANAEASS